MRFSLSVAIAIFVIGHVSAQETKATCPEVRRPVCCAFFAPIDNPFILSVFGEGTKLPAGDAGINCGFPGNNGKCGLFSPIQKNCIALAAKLGFAAGCVSK
ncbi:MAG: hypothetical protein J3R72DRAFT_222099 [Linnemannia gamsii]|nr:MAG: hypothetical protein J3R72DRAFT_222099 [Linnemannia gamsii]